MFKCRARVPLHPLLVGDVDGYGYFLEELAYQGSLSLACAIYGGDGIAACPFPVKEVQQPVLYLPRQLQSR